uniref:Macro domain-containing protein n=1 Tax=Trypanosoma congolense (strain IL3000) TaxID=1068625 RepID=G0UMY3_TRYCI|nr:conserved hypothetical protein [Trypanosoma congolense IL3000]
MSSAGKRGRRSTSQPRAFVTYSGHESGDLADTLENKKVKTDGTSKREKILSTPLSPANEAIFSTPLESWLTADRGSFSGWKCGVKNPVTMDKLQPVNSTDPFLRRIALYRGPVTDLELDAIVNAANTQCLGGGGVDGAIHRAAGPLLLRECATFNGCETGECRLTKGYQLPARYVFHTVGPVGEKPDLLRKCYRSVLSLAFRNRLRSIGFCCISTGVYGYPLLPATRIALSETKNFLKENADAFDMCCFACFQEEEFKTYSKCLKELSNL